MNIPTWFATLTLALTALSLAVAGLAEQRGTRDRVMWWALCAIFLYLSLDEATDLHGICIEGTPGLTLLDAPSGFDWVIPGAFVVFAVGALFIRWVLRLPRRTRNFFMLARALYVTRGLLSRLPAQSSPSRPSCSVLHSDLDRLLCTGNAPPTSDAVCRIAALAGQRIELAIDR